MSNTTYYQKNRDVILNSAKYYCESNKKRLIEQARDKYRNLSEEDKNEKRVYGRNTYCNMYEEKKQRLKEYKKTIVRLKSINLIINISYGFNSVCYDLVIHY